MTTSAHAGRRSKGAATGRGVRRVEARCGARCGDRVATRDAAFAKVSSLCTATFHANLAHNLTRSP